MIILIGSQNEIKLKVAMYAFRWSYACAWNAISELATAQLSIFMLDAVALAKRENSVQRLPEPEQAWTRGFQSCMEAVPRGRPAL
jgi:hypothetical protein